MAVYCTGCDQEFPKVDGFGYKEAGQAIKDQIPWIALEQFGPVVLTAVIFGPLTASLGLAYNWQAVMDVPRAWHAYNGSRTDAINDAQIPCPTCRRYVEWERRKRR